MTERTRWGTTVPRHTTRQTDSGKHRCRPGPLRQHYRHRHNERDKGRRQTFGAVPTVAGGRKRTSKRTQGGGFAWTVRDDRPVGQLEGLLYARLHTVVPVIGPTVGDVWPERLTKLRTEKVPAPQPTAPKPLSK